MTDKDLCSIVRQDFADAQGDDVEQERVASEGLGEEEFDGAEALGQGATGLGQVAADVDAGGQKVGHQHDPAGSLLDAAGAAVGDRRLGQLEERRDDDGMAAATQLGGDVVQVVVGLRMPAAVGDQEEGGRTHRLACYPFPGV